VRACVHVLHKTCATQDSAMQLAACGTSESRTEVKSSSATHLHLPPGAEQELERHAEELLKGVIDGVEEGEELGRCVSVVSPPAG
jgi:hypothetical protein